MGGKIFEGPNLTSTSLLSYLKSMPIDYVHITTPPVHAHINFLHVPDIGGPLSDDRYKITILISKHDTECIKEINNACERAANREWSGSGTEDVQMPLTDGETQKSIRPELANYHLCTFKSFHAPILQMPDGRVMPRSVEIKVGDPVRVFGAMGGMIEDQRKVVVCYLSGVQLLNEPPDSKDNSSVIERLHQRLADFLPWN